MTKRLIKNSPYWQRAERLLADLLGDRTEIGLNEAWAALDGLVKKIVSGVGGDVAKEESFIEQVLAGPAAADAVSRLLRARGFRKAGTMGSALTYDRQPLYRREAA